MSARPANGGFSLLEVLVALALLVLVFGALLELFGGGIRSLSRADGTTEAALTAEAMITRVGADIPLAVGVTRGVTTDGFHWTVTVSQFATDVSSPTVQPYVVTAEVEWDRGPADKSFRLSSILLGQKS